MNLRVCGLLRTAMAGAAMMATLGATTSRALAQTTVVLNVPTQQVVDTTIRGGTYASTNYGSANLETRASSDYSYVRRALLKFDTENFVPAGATIQSATLTLTIKDANPESRTLSAYRVSESFDEPAATWKVRKSSTAWSTTGATLGSRYASATAGTTAGSKVSFNVTSLVQDTVKGTFGSRYTRIAIVDGGAASKDSYRVYYSSEASDASVRPKLTVTYGSSTTTSGSTSTTSGTTLRVVHWNTHHGGYGTDGKYDVNRVVTWLVKMKPDVISLNEIEKNTEIQGAAGIEDRPHLVHGVGAGIRQLVGQRQRQLDLLALPVDGERALSAAARADRGARSGQRRWSQRHLCVDAFRSGL
jgi:hypothetical protein